VKDGLVVLFACVLAGIPVAGAVSTVPRECVHAVSSWPEDRAAALGRLLRVLGLATPTGGVPLQGCAMGRLPGPEDPEPAREPAPGTIAWILGPEGMQGWLAAWGFEPADRSAHLGSWSGTRVEITRAAPWYFGQDEPKGDVLHVVAVWQSPEAAREFAERLESRLRDDAAVLERVADWRMRRHRERVEVDLLAHREIEITPLDDDPWEEVEFGKEEP
jgi:hypothetical protein